MDNQGSLVPLDQLLAHREWVRRVARALVRDENTADDLEQGVWLEAMESPPRRGGSLRAWLASVLRHNLVDLRRSEARRRVREGAAEATGSHLSTADMVAQADLHRRIVVALMELPEPYRATLLLRYFHDLDSPAIAGRMAVPPETVRTRLARGIAMLRERFRSGGGADRGAWALLLSPAAHDSTGLPALPAAPVAAFAGGGLLVKASTPIAAGAAILATLGIGWALFRPAEEPGFPSTGRDPGRAPPPVAEVAAAAGAEPADPTPPEPGPLPAAAPAAAPAVAPEEPAPAAAGLARDRLPRLGGLEPVPAEAGRFDVEVDARGGVTVRGAAVTMADLGKHLLEVAEESREEGADGPSRVDVVVRADRDLPWQGAQWLMQACADPKVRIRRIHFAAASEDGRSEGVVPAFLPADVPAATPAPRVAEEGGGGTPVAEAIPVVVPLHLSHEASDSPVTAEDLFAHLQEKCGTFLEQGATVRIDAAPSVALGEVLEAVVAARRWGAKSVEFRGTRVFRGDYVEHSLAAPSSSRGSLAVKVLGTRVLPR